MRPVGLQRLAQRHQPQRHGPPTVWMLGIVGPPQSDLDSRDQQRRTRRKKPFTHGINPVTPNRRATPGPPTGSGERSDVGRRTLLSGALGASIALAAAACSNDRGETTASSPASSSPGSSPSSTSETDTAASDSTSASKPATDPTPAQIIARATVPVLCWHQVRDWEPADSDYNRQLLICPPKNFRAQLDAIVDDGWTSISPDDYLKHLTTGSKLPVKPVLLTFDDSQGSQITNGLPALIERDLTATFFIMTVVLGNPGWMTKDDVRNLHRKGMTVAGHTWDHHRVDEYSGSDWKTQLVDPRKTLERIIGEPVEHLAYPFGAWDEAALPHVSKAGYKTAFQLADKEPSTKQPLLTLQRSLVNSTWSGPQILNHLKKTAS